MPDDSDRAGSTPVVQFPFDDAARARLRRVPPMDELSAGLSKSLRDQWKLLLALRKLGVLIGMYLLFRENKCDPATCEAAARAFRQAGFFALWSGADGLMIVAEPCLALSFMLKAHEAGLLSEELEDGLIAIFEDGTPLRAEAFDAALAHVQPFMKSIDLIVSPALGATN